MWKRLFYSLFSCLLLLSHHCICYRKDVLEHEGCCLQAGMQKAPQFHLLQNHLFPSRVGTQRITCTSLWKVFADPEMFGFSRGYCKQPDWKNRQKLLLIAPFCLLLQKVLEFNLFLGWGLTFNSEFLSHLSEITFSLQHFLKRSWSVTLSEGGSLKRMVKCSS